MSYWVYENTTRKKARIHRAECSYCQNGRGIHDTEDSRHSRWHGPFTTIGEAGLTATATGQKDQRACTACLPAEPGSVFIPIAPALPPDGPLLAETLPPELKSAPYEKGISLRVIWRPIGDVQITDGTRGQKLVFPPTPNAPGIYKLIFKQNDIIIKAYVGESQDIRKRFYNYVNPGPTQSTSIRINKLILEGITNFISLGVHLCTDAHFLSDDGLKKLDFHRKPERRLVENYAIIAERSVDIEDLNL